MRNIIIVEAASTGHNYIEDIVRRGYNPVVLETRSDSEDLINFRNGAYAAAWHKPDIVRECETYGRPLKRSGNAADCCGGLCAFRRAWRM